MNRPSACAGRVRERGVVRDQARLGRVLAEDVGPRDRRGGRRHVVGRDLAHRRGVLEDHRRAGRADAPSRRRSGPGGRACATWSMSISTGMAGSVAAERSAAVRAARERTGWRWHRRRRRRSCRGSGGGERRRPGHRRDARCRPAMSRRITTAQMASRDLHQARRRTATTSLDATVAESRLLLHRARHDIQEVPRRSSTPTTAASTHQALARHQALGSSVGSLGLPELRHRSRRASTRFANGMNHQPTAHPGWLVTLRPVTAERPGELRVRAVLPSMHHSTAGDESARSTSSHRSPRRGGQLATASSIDIGRPCERIQHQRIARSTATRTRERSCDHGRDRQHGHHPVR